MEIIQGEIFDVRKYSIHDGPGIRTTVFFKGCPLSCVWCHNPEGQSPAPEILFLESRCIRCGKCMEVCPQNAVIQEGEAYYTDAQHCVMCGDCLTICTPGAREIAGKTMTVAEVMALIEQDVPFYDESGGGVTCSGGEPMLQRHFLADLLRACKEKEIHTTLDTCGFATWEALDSVRSFVDLFHYDIKLVDDAQHQKFTGVSNSLILSNFIRLANLGHRMIIRVPLIPGITDNEENLRQIALLAKDLPSVERVDLLPYHDIAIQKYRRLGKPYPLEDLAPMADEAAQQLAGIFSDYQIPVRVGG